MTTKVKIQTKGVAFLEQFDGQVGTLTETIGTSGKTAMVSLNNGGGIYLTPEQYTSA